MKNRLSMLYSVGRGGGGDHTFETAAAVAVVATAAAAAGVSHHMGFYLVQG